jgi:hypothetical protein
MTAPGFYPDPSGKPGQMYWDGQAWVPPAGPPQNPVPALRRRWTSLRTRTKIAVAVAVVAIPAFTLWASIGVADSVFGSSGGHSASSGGGNGAPNGGWRSPYQQQQANAAASQVCNNINVTPTGNDIADGAIGMGFEFYLKGIETQLTMSRDEAIAWIKSIAKDQCPEFIGNVSKWTGNK